jgi:hypothetical protein
MASAVRPSGWRPLEPGEEYAGRSQEQWAVEWARWSYAQTSCASPVVDADGSLCALYQDPEAPVFFLPTGLLGPIRTRCPVPAGKSILVPILMFTNDNGGVAPDEQLSDDELVRSVTDVKDSMRDLALRVDGEALTGLEQAAVGPTRFGYTVPPEPNWYSCNGMVGVEGPIEPSWLAGYFVLFPPPNAGMHSLEYGGTGTYWGNDFVRQVRLEFAVGAR